MREHLPLLLVALGSAASLTNARAAESPPTETVEVVAYASPQYTEAGRRARIHGVVSIGVTIDQRGTVVERTVEQRLPMGLSEQALAAARSWRFNRSRLERRAATLEFAFELDPDSKAQSRFEFTPPYRMRVIAPAPLVEVTTVCVGASIGGRE